MSVGGDPFEEPAALPPSRRQRLERLLDRLVEQGIDLAVVDQLGAYLTTGAAQELARIRPLALADAGKADPDQLVRACLHGARRGSTRAALGPALPGVPCLVQVTEYPRAIAEHGYCEACHLDFQLDFANSIEMIFRVHPEIRAADLATYCIGGPAHAPHVIARVRVAPGERIELDLEAVSGLIPPARSAIALVNRFSGPEFRDDPPLGGGPWFGTTTARPARTRWRGGQLLDFDKRSFERAIDPPGAHRDTK